MNLAQRILVLLLLASTATHAQDGVYRSGKNRFLSYGTLYTWACVMSDWEKPAAHVNLYDYNKYRGHSEFVASGLKRPIKFAQFKEEVKHVASRKYMPLFLYDLRQLAQDSFPAALKGKKWAVRLEDYGYDDTPQQMAKTITRLMQTMSAYIAREGGDADGGVLLLYSTAAQKPNAALLPFLGKTSFTTINYSEFMKSIGPPSLEVLSPGTAIGYLRLVPADSTDLVVPGVHDIAVYERSPIRVPALAGYISLTPQTPLSHVNLLALNRGTIHISMDGLKRLPGADTLLGRLVRIDCTPKEQHIRLANAGEAARSWKKLDAKTIQLPPPDKQTTGIVDLAKAGWQERRTNTIGAKASNYAIIHDLLPAHVRPGYALPMHYYFDVIEHCGAAKLIDSVSALPQEAVEKRRLLLSAIRDSIFSAIPDTAIVAALRQLQFTAFGGAPMRLRSSTNCEDLPGFNGAGLYLSERVESGAKISAIRKSMLRVFASLWTEPAFDERRFYHIDHRLAGMALMINEAFDDEMANGVSIIMPDPEKLPLMLRPVTSAVTILPPADVYINVQPGGHLVTNPDSGEVPEAILLRAKINARAYMHTQPDPRKFLFEAELKTQSSIGPVFAGPGMKADTLLEGLGELTLQIRNRMTGEEGYGIDIEFRIMEENGRREIWIKQARLLGAATPF